MCMGGLHTCVCVYLTDGQLIGIAKNEPLTLLSKAYKEKKPNWAWNGQQVSQESSKENHCIHMR